MERKTELIVDIIGKTSLPGKIKGKLKANARAIYTCQTEIVDAFRSMQEAENGLDQQDYIAIAAEVAREEYLTTRITQCAHRVWYVNDVLRIRQARLHEKALAGQLADICGGLLANGDLRPDDHKSVILLMQLCRSIIDRRQEDIIVLLDRVSGLSKARLLQDLTEVFMQKRVGGGIYHQPNFTSQLICAHQASPAQMQMNKATEACSELRSKLEEVWLLFIEARHSADLGTFSELVDAALLSGDAEALGDTLETRHHRQQWLAQVSAVYVELFKEVEPVSRRLRQAIQKAADEVTEFESVDGLVSMSNCLGAWHWLGEMVSSDSARLSYIEEKYRDCHPESYL